MHAGLALKGKAFQCVAVETELPVQCVYSVQQAHALGGVVGGGLAGQHYGVDGVLVADVCAGQVAVAFLKAEDVAFGMALGLQEADLLTDELEAGQGTAQLHAVLFGDGGGHVGGHDGSHGHGVLGHCAIANAGAADVVKQQHTHLVAGDEPVAALAVRHGGTHAVAVRVGAEHQVGLYGVAQLQAGLHGLADLWVGVGAGGEGAVRLLLLGHHGDLGHAHAVQQHLDRFQTGAVQRRVDQFEFGDIVAGAQGQYGIHEVAQTLVVDPDDLVCGHGGVKVGQLDGIEVIVLVDSSQHGIGGFQRDLAAVGTIDLVAVVLGGVVAGGHADARAAAQIAHSPGQRRGGLQPGVQVGGDAVGGQHAGGLAAEQLALVAAVVADGYFFRQACGVDVVRQALGGAADGVDIHAVAACADDAAQTACAKGQVAVKAVVDGIGITPDAVQFGEQVRILHCAGAPEVKQFCIGHGRMSFPGPAPQSCSAGRCDSKSA